MKHTLSAVVLVGALLVLFVAVPLATDASKQMDADVAGEGLLAPVTAPLFGVATRGEFMDPGIRQKAVEAGVRWARVGIKWNQVEAVQGTYDFSHVDDYLSWYDGTGILFLAVVSENPTWAATTTCGPLNIAPLSAFATFIGVLAERYDGDADYNGDGVDDGPAMRRIDYWQPYNEPDNKWPEYWDFGGCWGQNGAQYAQLLRLSRDAVRAANPDAQLGIGGLGAEPNPICAIGSCVGEMIFNTNILQGMNNSTPIPGQPNDFVDDVFNYIVANPGHQYFDFLDIHSYAAFANNWDGTAPYNNYLWGKANHYKLRMQNKGLLTGRYVICTEAGRPSSPNKTYFGVQGSDEEQSRFVVYVFAQGMRAGLRALTWYEYLDYDTALWGLLNSSSQIKPSYTAYKTLTQQLGAATFSTKLTSVPGVELYVFSEPTAGWRSVLWASARGTTVVPVAFLGADLYATDKWGVTTHYRDGQAGDVGPAGDGKVTINITASPIYVDGRPDAAPTPTPTPTRTATPTATPTPSTYQMALAAGWNLISSPLAPAQTAVTQTLSSINGHYDLAYTYIAADATDPWKKYNIAAPAFLNDLKVITEGMGIWVHTLDAVTLTLTGAPPESPTIQLLTGWNLVGYPSQVTRLVTETLSSCTGSYNLVYAYYAEDTTDPWKKYNIVAPAFLNDLKQISPGRGYWINMTQPCLWQVSTAP